MTSINVGEVETFRDVAPDKAQALKVLEEAAEVFGAWQDWDRVNGEDEIKAIMRRAMVVSECADVIQATCNLLAALGVEDFGPCMAACAGRNRERGRMRWARASTCARSSPCSA